jgi:hypothetical protein
VPTTSGAGDRKKKGKAVMVANLDSSATSEKQNTRKTNALTQEQSLEILAQAVLNCQQAGINVGLSQMYHHGFTSTLIVLANIELHDGKLVKVGGV